MNGKEFRFSYKDYRDGLIDTKYRKKRKGFEQNLRGCKFTFRICHEKKFFISAYNSLFSKCIGAKYYKYMFGVSVPIK